MKNQSINCTEGEYKKYENSGVRGINSWMHILLSSKSWYLAGRERRKKNRKVTFKMIRAAFFRIRSESLYLKCILKVKKNNRIESVIK